MSGLLLAEAGAGEPSNWPVVAAAAVVTVACVGLHYQVIALVIRALPRRRVRASVAIAAVVLVLLAAHLVEISLFAAAYHVLLGVWGESVGGIGGNFDGSLVDLFYFSIAVYTTVGFGDITPEGPLRVLTGVEALAGLMLVTWSASFTFLVMERHWQAGARRTGPAEADPAGRPGEAGAGDGG